MINDTIGLTKSFFSPFLQDQSPKTTSLNGKPTLRTSLLFFRRCPILTIPSPPNSGPDDTPFEFGVFRAILKFPPNYPQSPPSMRFTTPIFHPNGMLLERKLHMSEKTQYPQHKRLCPRLKYSLPRRPRLHLHSPSARRRPRRLRV